MLYMCSSTLQRNNRSMEEISNNTAMGYNRTNLLLYIKSQYLYRLSFLYILLRLSNLIFHLKQHIEIEPLNYSIVTPSMVIIASSIFLRLTKIIQFLSQFKKCIFIKPINHFYHFVSIFSVIFNKLPHWENIEKFNIPQIVLSIMFYSFNTFLDTRYLNYFSSDIILINYPLLF